MSSPTMQSVHDAIPASPAGQTSGRKPVGQILLEMGALKEEDLNQALAEGKKTGKSIGYVLLRRNLVTPQQLGKALATHFNVRYLPLMETPIQPAMLTMLPADFMNDRGVVPVAKESGRLFVAMVNPLDRSVIDEITFMTGIRPQPLVTTRFEFEQFVTKHLPNHGSAAELTEMFSAVDAEVSSRDAESIRQMRDMEMNDTSSALSKMVNTIIEQAIDRRASDIHIEPRKDKYLVRFRIDGTLLSLVDVPRSMETSLVTRVKVMARLDISEHRRPQDGRFAIKHKNLEFNLRVSVMPTSDGREKIVMRILRPATQALDFYTQGMDEQDVQKIELLYQKPHGILLIAGPTGSGKTTTLYTILDRINQDSANISTVEDPVELTIEGLNQTQVNPKVDFTFASSVRALMRQDPDVIMIGEIRDHETLDAAVHAALTGHLVFSTVHSNTSVGTISRLVQMGAENYLLSSALNGVVAQRLLRKVCPECCTIAPASFKEQKLLGVNRPIDLVKAVGCKFCSKTGYQGRIGVFEILVIDREIRQMIASNSTDLQIEDVAMANGLRTLISQGRQKVIDRVTTVEELVRVLGSG